jgi:hypothetical protein
LDEKNGVHEEYETDQSTQNMRIEVRKLGLIKKAVKWTDWGASGSRANKSSWRPLHIVGQRVISGRWNRGAVRVACV